jgi:hypothetical protein
MNAFMLGNINSCFLVVGRVILVIRQICTKQTAADEINSFVEKVNQLEKSNIAFKTSTVLYWLSGVFANIAL